MSEATPKIELVYFDGCPNAREARANLTRVLDSLELPDEWHEWVQDKAETPGWASLLPSPTILVDGRNVVGSVPEGEGRACAPGGAPSTEVIHRALAGTGE